MDPPKPFPILRLPFLAVQEIFKAMHPIEIINFSMISKRAKTITKNNIFYSKYDIRLHIEKSLGNIGIHGTSNLINCHYLMKSGEQMEKTVGGEQDGITIRRVFKYSKDPIEDWKHMCIYVLEIFKKETIDILSMTMDAFVDRNVSITNLFKTNEISVDECRLFQSEKENDVDEHVAFFLNNIKINSVLYSNVYIHNDEFNAKIPKHLKDLYIHNSQWIGYDRLLELDCEHVSLRNNKITNEEWSMFLKKWIVMETHLNLKCLMLDFKSLHDLRVFVLNDIPHEVLDESAKRTLMTYSDEKKEISGGVDIRRIDGKVATFFTQSGIYLMMIVN